MRELRPLLLPKLVAATKARQSAIASYDMTVDPPPVPFPHSCESFHSTATSASDCSTPGTPTFSIRGHSRYPSSNSSLASSPPSHDLSYLDSASSTTKLPKLTEEPLERDDHPLDDFVVLASDTTVVSPCLCDVDDCSHQPRSLHDVAALVASHRYAFLDNSFEDDADFTAELTNKRRRSGESAAGSITTRFENHFPSLSRRFKDRKRTSGLSIKTRNTTSSSRVPSRAPSTSRSSSLTGSVVQAIDQLDAQTPSTPSKSYFELHEDSSPTSTMDIVSVSLDAEPIDRESMVSTPLLPPTLMRLRDECTPSQSPLQSPTVAEPGSAFPFGNTPIGTPRLPAMPTPPLSSKPSCSSLSASRSGFIVPVADIPPLKISDSDDKWSAKLGHANFTIFPEPYMPEECDVPVVQQLFTDWELARHNFMKHQVRTGEHFGVTSKVYRLTDQKWAEIDAQWRKYHETAVTRAGLQDDERLVSSPSEPAPLVKLPSLNNKFPAKGDEDIVGPMVQVASQIQPPRSRKASLIKFFTDLKLGSFGLRVQR